MSRETPQGFTELFDPLIQIQPLFDMKNMAVFSRVDVFHGKTDAFPPPMVGNGIANDFGEERAGMFDSTPLEGSDAFEQRFLGQVFHEHGSDAGRREANEGLGIFGS